MKSLWTIFRKEFAAYFISPIAYIFIIVFLVISCGLFMTNFFLMGLTEMRAYFNMLPWVLIVFIPAVTMRLWSEERKSGTIALLQSLPVSSVQLVLGKFLASLAFYLTALAGTFPIPIMLSVIGTPDYGPILGGYFGSVFLGAFYLAIGIFISAFFKDQIVSFILSMVICFIFFMLGTDFVATFVDGWIPQFGSFLSSTIGLASHFSAIERGVIDSKDILYFLSFTVAFLFLNTYTLESSIKLHSRRKFAINCAIFFGIAIVVNMVVMPVNLGRFDLTRNNIYTISDSSRKVVERLKDVPLDITYYVTPKAKMPTAFKSLEQDVVDKLTEFRKLSKNIRVAIVDPTKGIEDIGTETEDTDELAKKIQEKVEKLQSKGIVPFNAQSIEQDSFNVKRIYSAISISYLDRKEEVIPQVIPQNLNTLEYELVSKIYRMTLEKKPKIALFAPMEYPNPQMKDPAMRQIMMQMGQKLPMPEDYYSVIDETLKHQGYDVRRIDLTKDSGIPEDVKTLIVMKPDSLNERQRYEINKALARGTNLFMAVQKYNYNYSVEEKGGVQVVPYKIDPGVNPFMSSFGITVSDEILMDNNHETVAIPSRKKIGMFSVIQNQPVKMPIHIRVLEKNMNKEVSITDQLSSLFYLWGTSLNIDTEKLNNLNLNCRILASSGDTSWTIPAKEAPLNKSDITAKLHDINPNQPLIVLVEGKFPFSYEGKDIPGWPRQSSSHNPMINQPPAQEEGEEEPEGIAPEIERIPAKAIISGCAEMFKDQLILSGGNPLFFLNAIDSLTLGEELIGIRSKGKAAEFIGQVSSGTKLFYKFFVVFFIPILWIVFGVFRVYMRKRRRAMYQLAVVNA
ncbi:MAG: ABC transporter permease subunit [Candidatus Kuenenia sp.]|nr:ABC transporter permease subunit [Candidatus Kuenenia hertensis]